MGQLIQGKSSKAAPPESTVWFELLMDMGFRLAGQNKNKLDSVKDFALYYSLILRDQYPGLDIILAEYGWQITEENKKTWVKQFKNKPENNELINRITLLWKGEKVLLKNINKIKFVVKDRYFPINQGDYVEYDQVKKVIDAITIAINGELKTEIDLSTNREGVARINAEITADKEGPGIQRTYTGEVGPELMPFPYEKPGHFTSTKFKELKSKYDALPKVVYRFFDALIYIEKGYILLNKDQFESKKNGQTLIVTIRMQPVWYRDTTKASDYPGYQGNYAYIQKNNTYEDVGEKKGDYIKNSTGEFIKVARIPFSEEDDLKISDRRIPVSGIIIHHTGTPNFISPVSGWGLKNTVKSIHYCIDRDGIVVKLGVDNFTTNQTGESHWRKDNISVNDFSIGIEIIHNDENEEFTEEQYETLIKLINRIKEKFNGSYIDPVTKQPVYPALYHGKIKDVDIVGHCDIAFFDQSAKTSYDPGANAKLGQKARDPGLKFDFRILEEAKIGLYFKKEFSMDEFKQIRLDYGLANDPSFNEATLLQEEIQANKITLQKIYSLIDYKEVIPKSAANKTKLKPFIEFTSHADSSDEVKDLYEKLRKIGYFCGVIPKDPEKMKDFTYPQVDSAMQMLQIHFHPYIYPPEEPKNAVNLSNFNLKYNDKYLINIYTMSIFIIHALIRDNVFDNS